MERRITKGQQKIRLQFERLLERESFADEVTRVRHALGIPNGGAGQGEQLKISRELYDVETKALREKLPVQNENIISQLQDYIFYNVLSERDLGDVCEIEDAESEFALYSTNEDPESSGTNAFRHNDQILEKLSRYPVSIRIHAEASQRSVAQFITKNWSLIESAQKSFAKLKNSSSLKNSKTRVTNKERDEFIYEHRDLPRKELASLVIRKYGDFLDTGYISKIISNEEKRRKV